MKKKVRHVKILARCGMLRHASKPPPTAPRIWRCGMPRHAAACRGMLLPLVLAVGHQATGSSASRVTPANHNVLQVTPRVNDSMPFGIGGGGGAQEGHVITLGVFLHSAGTAPNGELAFP